MPQLDEFCYLPRGKITQTKTGDSGPLLWVYQRTHPDHGNVRQVGSYGLQLRRHVIPYDPKTPAQIARRATFRDAVQSWQALDHATKEQWKRAARSSQRSGYNHFISYTMRGIPAPFAGAQLSPPTQPSTSVAAVAHWQNPPPK